MNISPQTDSMGFPLCLFKNDLARVPAHYAKAPIRTCDVPEILGSRILAWADEEHIDQDAILRQLPFSLLRRQLSFDQICKARYSEVFMMHSSVEQAFETNPEFLIVQKIANSMWRWGGGAGVWNEVVDAYDGLRCFSLGVAGFEIRLDWTTGFNERGYSREARIYLDGVFGFLVYYRGEHVLTLGFSFMAGHRLLVQQIQLAKRKGNRFLFKLPRNRVEFAIQCFGNAFPLHRLCLADGGDICLTSLRSYQRAHSSASSRLARKYDVRDEQERCEFERRIAHLEADLPRIAELYKEAGAFTRAAEFVVNGIRHYNMEPRCATAYESPNFA
ncbi:hypothetical protein [Herbaspirillum huttiense]|uniref:hypothetical protein n=1 Tax=Herbaspirillum huttiense TaxID=863372 RepID=UPI0039B111D2